MDISFQLNTDKNTTTTTPVGDLYSKDHHGFAHSTLHPLEIPHPFTEQQAAEALLRLGNPSTASVSSTLSSVSTPPEERLPSLTDMIPFEPTAKQKPSKLTRKKSTNWLVQRAKPWKATTKPRWQESERLNLFHAIVEDKKLDDMATFQWDRIAMAVGRAKKACKDQWRREVLPSLMKGFNINNNCNNHLNGNGSNSSGCEM